MDWSKGYSATYYATVVHKGTWRDTDRIEITGGTINRSPSGLRDSADIETTGYHETEQYIRIYLDTDQSGAFAHVPLFTGLATTPERNINGYHETNSIQCYSVLKAAEDVLLERGYYAPVDTDAGVIIQNLLSVIPAPVKVIGEAPKLKSAIIAESKENHRSMADKVLEAMGNWRMRIGGDGTIFIEEKPDTASAMLDPVGNDIIEPTINIKYDWYSAPNVLRAIDGDMVAVARDDDKDSPLSTVSRGREIWTEEKDCKLNTGESIAEYAIRRLGELQDVALTASYDRRYIPDLAVGDLVRLAYPRQGLDGLFRITSQTVTLGYGARTNEEVEKV